MSNKNFHIEVWIDNAIYSGKKFSAGNFSDVLISKRDYSYEFRTLREKVEIDLWNEENMENISF